jgi:phosphonate transport system substrate-binding protein
VFAQNKIDAKTFFKLSRGANHEANALAVANKQVDVATNNSESLDKIKDKLPEKFNDIRIIWTSPLIPMDPLVIRKDLPEATKAKVRDFFYSYGKTSSQEKENLFKLNKLSGFKQSSNSQLIPIRQLELFKTRNKFETDVAMSADEKQAKLADIDKQLAALAQAK